MQVSLCLSILNTLIRWKLKRPSLTSIQFQFKKLDLEEHPECLYDYVVITTKPFSALEELTQSRYYAKYCRKDQVGMEITISYDEYAYIYFISDRSSSYSGFSLDYKLGCRTFDYIMSSRGIYDVILESPSYPNTYRYNYSCLWSIMLQSNRDISVTSVDMDLAPRDSACNDDVLKLVSLFVEQLSSLV